MTHFPTNLICQHLIDPEICIRCNSCEESCPNGSITHDSKNYVVEFRRVSVVMHAWKTALQAQLITR